MHIFLFTNSAQRELVYNVYAEYTQLQLTFLTLQPYKFLPLICTECYCRIENFYFRKNTQSLVPCFTYFLVQYWRFLYFFNGIQLDFKRNFKWYSMQIWQWTIHSGNLRYASGWFCGDIVVFLGFKVLTLMILPAVKGLESFTQTQIFLSLYLSNLMVQVFYISNLDYLI